MTDVRDPEPRIEVEAGTPPPARRRGLMSRALAPSRRGEGGDPRPAPLVDIDLDTAVDERPRRRGLAIVLSLVFIVVLPSLASGVYLFAFASDQYVSETRFAVRKSDASGGVTTDEDKTATPTTGSILTGGFNLAGEDAEIIASYIHSRAIVNDVSRDLDVRAIFQRPQADAWARLPKDASAEALDAYWRKMVSAYVETSSGIVQVSVSAFRRDDALALAQAVLKSSESLANAMTLKIRADQMKTAEDEVHRSEGAVRFALADLTSFRDSEHVLDPKLSSESTGKLLFQLMSDKIQTEGQLFVARRVQGENAPGLGTVKARLDSINAHITELQDQMAGSKDMSNNMAATMARFEELELKKQFAERMYGFAHDGVERARIAAERQAIYLAVFEPPAIPQDSTYPLRWTDFLLVSAAGLMLWVCGATVTASVLDHRL